MRKIVRAIKQLWRLAAPYWLESEERLGSWLLLIATYSNGCFRYRINPY